LDESAGLIGRTAAGDTLGRRILIVYVLRVSTPVASNPLSSPQPWNWVADGYMETAMPLLGLFDGLTRGNAPFEIVRRDIGEQEWSRRMDIMRDYLGNHYGPFPLRLGSTACLGQGRKPL
jgi:hypothetical protein